MSYTFLDATAFNQDIGDWDTSKVASLTASFASDGCDPLPFNQDIGAWDTSSVTDMEGAFYGAAAFNHDLGDWDVSKVTNMHIAFASAFADGLDQCPSWAHDDAACPTESMGMDMIFFRSSDGLARTKTRRTLGRCNGS